MWFNLKFNNINIDFKWVLDYGKANKCDDKLAKKFNILIIGTPDFIDLQYI